VDFPQVWKNSGYTPSYTMTVRLYNPNPASLTATQKYIIGPLAALMLLGLPRSKDGSTYNWPFLHQIRAPGIYNLNPAFIQNVAVIKGGDQQSIAWNQRLAMVDVRIDFGSLYNSILAGEEYDSEMRPTLRNYLAAMEEEIEVKPGILYGEPSKYEHSPRSSASYSDVRKKNTGFLQKSIDFNQAPESRTNIGQQIKATRLAADNVARGIQTIIDQV
ncbi:hypothetical protein KAR91_06595, partial [Candidatus Pacearchaeota archaeon]|nr:hypothetical protein [Candidatus Pacearchaeota archaeon]